MRIVKPETKHERICIYGGPKSGKTRLATALPWGEFWGERAVYVAADPNSASLRSTGSVDASHFTVVEPRSATSAKYDPLHEAVEIATHKWEGHGTLVWDTLTQTAHDLLSAYARLGNYAKEQITFGKIGSPEYHAHPTPGDYGAAQTSSTVHLLDLLFDQPLHLIVVCHEDWAEPKNANECIGGPATVGQAAIKALAGRFDTVIRVENKRTGEPGKPKVQQYIARTQPHGIWICNVRLRPGTTLTDTVLEEEPQAFWKAYEAAVS